MSSNFRLVAQLVEQSVDNRLVNSSNLFEATIYGPVAQLARVLA